MNLYVYVNSSHKHTHNMHTRSNNIKFWFVYVFCTGFSGFSCVNTPQDGKLFLIIMTYSIASSHEVFSGRLDISVWSTLLVVMSSVLTLMGKIPP